MNINALQYTFMSIQAPTSQPFPIGYRYHHIPTRYMDTVFE